MCVMEDGDNGANWGIFDALTFIMETLNISYLTGQTEHLKALACTNCVGSSIQFASACHHGGVA